MKVIIMLEKILNRLEDDLIKAGFWDSDKPNAHRLAILLCVSDVGKNLG